MSAGNAELPALLTTVFLGHLEQAPSSELSLRLYVDLLAVLVKKGFFTQSQIEDTFEECLSEFQVCICVCVCVCVCACMCVCDSLIQGLLFFSC